MPLATRPLLAWGSADDISASPWSSVGTLAPITTTTDPFGGSGAYTLNDTDGAVLSRRQRNLAVTADGTHRIVVGWRAGTATESQIVLFETSGGATRGSVTITAAGPVFTASGGGTFYGPIAVGAGWYIGILEAPAMVLANTPAVLLRPAGGSNPAATGSASFFIRNMLLPDLIDEATSWEDPREGSEFDQRPSGAEDSLVIGYDQLLEGKIRWVPPTPSSEGIISGWYGDNESIGVNCGVKAMLRAGREKSSLLWVPDRSICTAYQTAYLAEPMKGKPDPEANGYRQFSFRLRGSQVFTGL